ncbi:MAG: peptidylprolyl isomerase [Elainellaceae cyanobacterium]
MQNYLFPTTTLKRVMNHWFSSKTSDRHSWAQTYGLKSIQRMPQFEGFKRVCLSLIIVLGVLTGMGLGNGGAIAAPLPDESFPNGTLISRLPPGNAVSDGKALLRYALPIDNKTIRDLQLELEDIAETLRVKGSRRVGSVSRNVSRASKVLRHPERILEDIPDARKADAEVLITSLTTQLDQLQTAVDEQDKEKVWTKRGEILDVVGDLEGMMVTGFPFEVPEQYSDLPQLLGRATIELETNKGILTMVADGYNAPVTSGNFVDLIQRGFYDGLEIIRAEDFYVVQTGNPPGADEGFIDPKTGEYRAIPMEIMVQGYDEPLYGETMESAGFYLDDPVLPFAAYGTVAMARPGGDPNGASSQFFFLKFEAQLTPAGLNLLDGRYAVFGYVTDGKDVLDSLVVGDRIESASVVKGLENLVEPS